MQILVVVVAGLFIISLLGPWFWILLAVAAAIVGIGYVLSEIEDSNLSPEERERREEEKEERRQRREEERHAMRMARIERTRLEQQAEVQLEAQKKTTRNQLLGTVGKVALSAGLHALSNGAIKHRHRH